MSNENDVTLSFSEQPNITVKYDAFISHANADKVDYVNELKRSIDKLKLSVFYDTDTLEWGDNWKDKLREGIESSEFAIIVISESFFGREWTEKELESFLNRQNSSGQKVILPILHNISMTQLKEKYPSVADIQALNSKDYSCDEIALMFARQLIVRIRSFSDFERSKSKQLDFNEQTYLTAMLQTYNKLAEFRVALRSSNTEEINRIIRDLHVAVQKLYDYYEYNRDMPGSRQTRSAKAIEIVNQYNAFYNALLQLVNTSNNDVSPLANEEYQKLLRLVIDNLHEETPMASLPETS